MAELRGKTISDALRLPAIKRVPRIANSSRGQVMRDVLKVRAS